MLVHRDHLWDDAEAVLCGGPLPSRLFGTTSLAIWPKGDGRLRPDHLPTTMRRRTARLRAKHASGSNEPGEGRPSLLGGILAWGDESPAWVLTGGGHVPIMGTDLLRGWAASSHQPGAIRQVAACIGDKWQGGQSWALPATRAGTIWGACIRCRGLVRTCLSENVAADWLLLGLRHEFDIRREDAIYVLVWSPREVGQT